MEHQRLVQLVQLQSQEIDSLKDEISSLSRKGGHMLPPTRLKENGSHNMTLRWLDWGQCFVFVVSYTERLKFQWMLELMPNMYKEVMSYDLTSTLH